MQLLLLAALSRRLATDNAMFKMGLHAATGNSMPFIALEPSLRLFAASVQESIIATSSVSYDDGWDLAMAGGSPDSHNEIPQLMMSWIKMLVSFELDM
ncbi:hypothetical protein BDK51DRAFT_38985 [Blyttiomyces helicus]|uniref:Uncharacterized protein n=1 Tax=Blyttiomyces helicus TaxID=388810 RepID=A0A4P9WAX9_9FUNG|nr:hypothetical protein BDK51DRAFT_38985 [Blyttiomyces helicus]|eukprot:RKO88735.1 hypothetical protein BDK51DRAFT_38985 [Blyttiomyces helicus]